MQVKSEKIRQFIIDNFLFGQQALSDAASFLENGIIDSTGIMELISFIEREHGMSISTDELIPENFDSIDRITRFLQQKLQAGERNYEAAV